MFVYRVGKTMPNLIHIALLIFGWFLDKRSLVIASLSVAVVCLAMSFCFYVGQMMRRNREGDIRAGKAVTMIWIQMTVIVLSLVWLCVRARA